MPVTWVFLRYLSYRCGDVKLKNPKTKVPNCNFTFVSKILRVSVRISSNRLNDQTGQRFISCTEDVRRPHRFSSFGGQVKTCEVFHHYLDYKNNSCTCRPKRKVRSRKNCLQLFYLCRTKQKDGSHSPFIPVTGFYRFQISQCL